MSSPMTKVMAPPQMKIKAGSKAMLVSLDRLLKVSFSVLAQIPMANTPRPRSCNNNNHQIKLLAEKCSKTDPEDDVEAEDDIFEAA